MIGYAMGGSVLLFGLFAWGLVVLCARVAHALARGRRVPQAWRALWTGGVILGLVSLTRARTGWDFFGLELLLLAWLSAGVAVASPNVRADALTARLGTWLGLTGMTLGFLVRRGALEGGAPSAAYAFVLHDHLGQLLLPLLDGIGRALGAGAAAGTIVAAAVDGLLQNLTVIVGLAGWVAAAALLRIARPSWDDLRWGAASPGIAWDGLVLVALLMASLAASVAPETELARWTSLARDGLLALHVGAGLSLLRSALRPLRTGLAFTGLAALLLLFMKPVVFALAGLGLIERLTGLGAALEGPGLARRAGSVTPRGLATGMVGTALVLAGLGAVSDTWTRSRAPAESDEQVCAEVEARVEDARGTVRYVGPSFEPFGIDRHERALPQRQESDSEDAGQVAARVCALEGKRLCTSNEWYVACACGYEETLREDRIPWRPRRIMIDHALVERARRDCPAPGSPNAVESHADCRSDQGVFDLLGRRSEILLDRPAPGAILVAGRNDVLLEDWMVKCGYRGMITEGALARHRWPFVGVRCCEDARGQGERP